MAAIIVLEALRAWLSGPRDYDAGAALYERYGANALLKRLFGQGATPFNRRKLIEELEALAAEQPAAVAPTPRTAHVVDPPEVQELIEERVKAFREGARLQSQLELLPSDDERLTAALRIRELIDRNEEIWHALEYFKQHGHLPEPPPIEAAPVPELPDGRAELLQRRNNLRTYLSSKRGTAQKRATWQAELDAVMTALEEEGSDG